MELITCSECGFKNTAGVSQCAKCGMQINIIVKPPVDPISKIKTKVNDPIQSVENGIKTVYEPRKNITKENTLSSRRIILFIFFVLIGSILTSVAIGFIEGLTEFSVHRIKHLSSKFYSTDTNPLFINYKYFDKSFIGYYIYAFFGLFFWLSITSLFDKKFRLLNLILSIISWSIIFYGLLNILPELSSNWLKVFVPATIATFISIKAFKLEIIGYTGRIILSLGWGLAIWFGTWSFEEGFIFSDVSEFAKAISVGINIAVIGIVFSFIALQLQIKNIFQVKDKVRLNKVLSKKLFLELIPKFKTLQQKEFSNDDKQTFFISLLLVITSFFLPFYRHDGYSGFVIDEGYIILSFTALLIFNFMFVIKGKPFISLLLSNTIYLLLLITVFIVIKYGDYSGGLFFDESDYSVDLGFYLFIFSIFLSVYTLNKNRFLIRTNDENKIK